MKNSYKTIVAEALVSMHEEVKELAMSLALEVDYSSSKSTKQVLVNGRAITKVYSMLSTMDRALKVEEEMGERLWTYTAPRTSYHPQSGMSYSLLNGIDGWLRLAKTSLLNEDVNDASKHIMMTLVLLDEFTKLNK
jgi:hypothetical protein